jgi:hypothetical protein
MQQSASSPFSSRQIVVRNWNELGAGVPTEVEIRRMFSSADTFRISTSSFLAGAEFHSRGLPMRVFILAARCRLKCIRAGDEPEVEAGAGEFVEVTCSMLNWSVIGASDLKIVKVWSRADVERCREELKGRVKGYGKQLYPPDGSRDSGDL